MGVGDKEKLKLLIKSQRGGLSGIIFEIMLSILALSLLVMVIYIFRGNLDIIGSSANKANHLSKVTEQSLVPLDKYVVKGSDVVSAVRYYAEEDEVEVNVVMGAEGAVVYGDMGHGFNISEYALYGYSTMEDFKDLLFDAEYQHEGNRLVKINYIKK